MDHNPQPEELPFNQRVVAVMRRRDELSFEELVREMRQIEAEFVTRAGDNEYHVVETRRRITERLLSEALNEDQPQEVCRAIWEELLERGFSDFNKKNSMSGIYARCCQFNGEFDAGLAVVEPVIAELQQYLASATLKPDVRSWYENDLAFWYQFRDELKAGIRE